MKTAVFITFQGKVPTATMLNVKEAEGARNDHMAALPVDKLRTETDPLRMGHLTISLVYRDKWCNPK